MKKVLFSILFLGVLLFPLVAFAGEYEADGQTIHFEGFVPCGKSEPAPGEDPEVTMPCQFCHFFVMAKAVLDFIVEIVLVVGVLMLVIGGGMFIFGPLIAPGNPKLVSQAQKLMTSVVIGLIIIFGAWIFVNTFFLLIGVADWTGLREGWFIIDCPIQLP